MLRRGFLALVGGTALAGCGSDGDGDTESETPMPANAATRTPTQSESDTQPTDTPTETLTGEQRATAALDAASASISDAHAVYLGYASADAERLLDVGPETQPFDGDRIQTICEQASDHVATATESARAHQQARIERLRSAATWLSGAARVQDALNSVTAAVQRAEQTATGGADYATVATHFAATRQGVTTVAEAYGSLEPPRNNSFEEFDEIATDDVSSKHRQLGLELRGLEAIAEQIDAVIGAESVDDGELGGALERLQTAREAVDAEQYERAASVADDAAETLADVAARTDGIGSDSLAPIVTAFETAVVALRDRARTLRDDAQAQSA